MSLIDLLPETLDVRVMAGDDLILNLTFESLGNCTAPVYVDLSSANVTASIITGNTIVSGSVGMANSANGSLQLIWNHSQTLSLSGTTNPWDLQVVQGDFEWTPIKGKIEVVARG